MIALLFLAAPVVVLFAARLYASAHSNPSQTTAEALVRWLYTIAWFAGSLAAGADWALNHYRKRRWDPDRQPGCESNRPWPAVAEESKPAKHVPLFEQLKAWVI